MMYPLYKRGIGRPLMCLLATALLVFPRPVSAQQTDPQALAKAQKLYDEAMEQMDAQNFLVACPKLEDVTKLVPKGIGGKLALAECYEGLARLASAWRQYAEVQSLAISANETDAATEAGAKVAELQPKLAMLRFLVSEDMRKVPGFLITLDGVPLDLAVLATAIAVDPGKHEIEASAPGRQSWKPRIGVQNGFFKDVEIPNLPELMPLPPSAPDEPPPAAKAMAPQPIVTRQAEAPLSPTPAPSSPHPSRVPLVLVVGGASFVSSVVLAGIAAARYNQSNSPHDCSGQTNICLTDDGLRWRQEAFQYSYGATAAFVLGAVVVGAGVPLAILWHRADEKGATKKASWMMGIDGRGLSVRGSF